MRWKITCPCCGRDRASYISRFRHSANEYLCNTCWQWAFDLFVGKK